MRSSGFTSSVYSVAVVDLKTDRFQQSVFFEFAS